MPPRGYDHFMLHARLGGSGKVRQLGRGKDQRWAWVAGVLAIASEADPRGHFLVAGEPATAEDVARMADVSVAIARSVLERAREREMLIWVEGSAAEYIHDWHEHNPDPRVKPSDSREARRERQRTSRAQRAGGHAPVTPMSREGHAPAGRNVTPHVTPLSRPMSREGHAPPSRAVTGARTPEGKEGEGEGEVFASLTPRADTPGLTTEIDEVLAILTRSPRFTVDDVNTRVGVENAMGAKPQGRYLEAAHTAVAWASDSAFHMTNPVAVLLKALDKQQPAAKASGPTSRLEQQDANVTDLLAEADRLEAEGR